MKSSVWVKEDDSLRAVLSCISQQGCWDLAEALDADPITEVSRSRNVCFLTFLLQMQKFFPLHGAQHMRFSHLQALPADLSEWGVFLSYYSTGPDLSCSNAPTAYRHGGRQKLGYHCCTLRYILVHSHWHPRQNVSFTYTSAERSPVCIAQYAQESS